MKTPIAPKFTALKNKHEKNDFENKRRTGEHSLSPLSTTVYCKEAFYPERPQKHFLFIASQMW